MESRPSIRLPRELEIQIEIAAARHGFDSKSQMTRYALEKFFEWEPTGGPVTNPDSTDTLLKTVYSKSLQTSDILDRVRRLESQIERHKARLGRPGTTWHAERVRAIERNERALKAIAAAFDKTQAEIDSLLAQIEKRKEEKPNVPSR
jgi:Arc/MetJ-type ribon-helix-helix transcriptional regulator